MIVKSINVVNFKKFKEFDWCFDNKFNIICGMNASGKTSILDAIHYLLLLRTTGMQKKDDVIMHGEQEFALKGDFYIKNREKKLFILNSNNSQKTTIDGAIVKSGIDYTQNSCVVSFNDKDIFSLISSPSTRRKMIDIIICQYNKSYAVALKNYRKIIKEKNYFLKSALYSKDSNLINALGENQFILSGEIYKGRIDFINSINGLFNHYHLALSDNKEKVSIKIKSDYNSSDSVEDFLKKCERDKTYKTCTWGSHRDDYEFSINNINIINTASQGQIKSLMLSFKLACAALLEDKKQDSPIILLDDVFGELDKKRQNKLVDLLMKQNNQVFITTPTISDLEKNVVGGAHIINLTKEEL